MRQRYVDRITFTASSISTIDLPREHWAKKITLLLDGQCDSGSSVSRSAYNPFEIITRIEVIERFTNYKINFWKNALLA